jgi:hypothetical protein
MMAVETADASVFIEEEFGFTYCWIIGREEAAMRVSFFSFFVYVI